MMKRPEPAKKIDKISSLARKVRQKTTHLSIKFGGHLLGLHAVFWAILQ